MGRRRLSEGGKHSPRRPYVAMVEGIEYGVPFRIFMKSMTCAEKAAQKVHGSVVTCLFTLKKRRWVGDEWRDAG